MSKDLIFNQCQGIGGGLKFGMCFCLSKELYKVSQKICPCDLRSLLITAASFELELSS